MKKENTTETTNYYVNGKYKDRLFRFIFGNERYKADLLQIYNALNHSAYDNPDELELNTIEDVVYMKMKNDVSYILKSIMSLYEQQSTFCPNMPMRGLMYFSKMYDKWLTNEGKNLYGKKLIKIPAPQYYVFYNGEDYHGDCEYLRLSDAFETPVEGFEWTATMLNINKGHNKELLEKCEALRDYSDFVSLVKQKKQEYQDLLRAVDEAVEIFKNGNGTLAEVLRNNEAEVKDMYITEYNEEATLDAIREEGIEEGIEKGIKKEILNTIIKKINKGKTLEQIADELEKDTEEVEPLYKFVLENSCLSETELIEEYMKS